MQLDSILILIFLFSFLFHEHVQLYDNINSAFNECGFEVNVSMIFKIFSSE